MKATTFGNNSENFDPTRAESDNKLDILLSLKQSIDNMSSRMLAFETTVSEKIDKLEGQYSTLEEKLQSISQPEIQISEPVIVEEQAAEFGQAVDQVVLQIFKKFDDDNSGTIDREEARQIMIDQMKKSGMTKVQVTEEALDQWFNEADVNGDGQISLEEAKEFVKNHFI